MNFITNALASLSRITSSLGNQPVQITFTPSLPPQVRQQIATQSLDHPLTLTVSNSNGNQLTFTSPAGQTFTATVNPPLPVGTQLQLSAQPAPQPSANSLPIPQLPSGTPAPAPAPSSPTPQLTIQAKIVTPDNTAAPTTGAAPVTKPALPQPVQPQLLTLAPGSQITNRELRTLITTSFLQQTATVPTITQPAPTPTLPVPAGPIAITTQPPLPTSLQGQPLTLTPTGPLLSNGTQTATLTPTAAPSPQPIRITLNLGVELPLAKPQTALLLPATTLEVPTQTTPQPVLFLTGQQATPNLPSPPTPGIQIQLPATPQSQPATQSANQPEAPQPTIPVAARILPNVLNQAPGTQTALLATGALITLKSPQPLPTGSIIVADLPITPNTGIQRVLTPDTNSQSQPNVTAQTQTAAPVAAQTQQAVLAPGMVIQGTITGQNEQGQPLLTITQPGALAGATVPLTLTENTTLLPVGAQLNIRVEDSLTATILTLTLPPQTQTAYTVGTLGGRWEALQQGLSVLQQQAPLQAANLRASLPQLANLLPGLIAFTNALRTKNLDDAFNSEATRLLKSMGIDLSSDISQLSQLQQRPAQNADTQWRGTLFPYVEAPGEDPRQGGFFWRREKSDNPRSPTNTRFVVEVEMSQMGQMQLDGLITYPEIWLKLRRTSAPEPGFIEGLQTLVNGLLQTSGLTGGIAVETTTTFPVNPRTELLGSTENPLPTTA